MRIRSLLPMMLVVLSMLTTACDKLTAPEVQDQLQEQIHFPPSQIGSMYVDVGSRTIGQVMSFYAPEGVVPVSVIKVIDGAQSPHLVASVELASQPDLVCTENKCKVAWNMYVDILANTEGSADVTISLKANPQESIQFHVVAQKSCYDQRGNYICKG